MTEYLFVVVILVISSIIYLKLAIKFKIIDKPNERSSHTKITVRGGGVLFPIAILLFFLSSNYQYPYFVLGVFLISVISFLDDIYTLSSKIRFPFQIIAIALILFQLNIPFEFWFVFYTIFGVGLVNMFNFMDGINGITGIYCLSVLLGFYMINLEAHFVNNDLIIYSALSLLVFGFYNFRKKALFFAGDIGSVAIGMLIVFLGFIFTVELSTPLFLLLIIVYGGDAGCTLLYRKLFTNESIFDPHRHHIYQKLVDVYKIPHLRVSIIYASIQIIMNIIALKIYTLHIAKQLYVFFGLVVFFVIIYVFLFKVIEKKKKNTVLNI